MEQTKNPVNWFEIPVTDIDRARGFYESILKIEMKPVTLGNLEMAWFPSGGEGYGATGTLLRAKSYIPSHQGTMVYLAVDDVATVLDRVEGAGGKVLNPKMAIGESGFVGHFEDSEGNRVGLHSDK